MSPGTGNGGKNKGGRPPYRPTINDRVIVEQMKFCGESENVIARALRIDPHTLRKHFDVELQDGYANQRKAVIAGLFDAASKGNVTALKRLDDMGRKAGASEAIDRRGKKAPEAGKKEQIQAAAEQIEGIFAPPKPPQLKLVSDNK